MTEIAPYTEKQARRLLSTQVSSQIYLLSIEQPKLKSEAAPLYRTGKESDLTLALARYAERMCNRRKLRALHLAYAFLRGVPLEKLERKSNEAAPLKWALELAITSDSKGINSGHRKDLSEEFKRWAKGEKQAFFAKLEEARAEALSAVAE